ncbi:hypothetical protein [Streptomyces purpurascens]|uniref:Uncharacterized protein n=1 Tax=Streptomyces purpurascens TaxID=1924 RepID=A0ABZ1MRC3_STREF
MARRQPVRAGGRDFLDGERVAAALLPAPLLLAQPPRGARLVVDGEGRPAVQGVVPAQCGQPCGVPGGQGRRSRAGAVGVDGARSRAVGVGMA